jgi:hypothetical protein
VIFIVHSSRRGAYSSPPSPAWIHFLIVSQLLHWLQLYFCFFFFASRKLRPVFFFSVPALLCTFSSQVYCVYILLFSICTSSLFGLLHAIKKKRKNVVTNQYGKTLFSHPSTCLQHSSTTIFFFFEPISAHFLIAYISLDISSLFFFFFLASVALTFRSSVRLCVVVSPPSPLPNQQASKTTTNNNKKQQHRPSPPFFPPTRFLIYCLKQCSVFRFFKHLD